MTELHGNDEGASPIGSAFDFWEDDLLFPPCGWFSFIPLPPAKAALEHVTREVFYGFLISSRVSGALLPATPDGFNQVFELSSPYICFNSILQGGTVVRGVTKTVMENAVSSDIRIGFDFQWLGFGKREIFGEENLRWCFGERRPPVGFSLFISLPHQWAWIRSFGKIDSTPDTCPFLLVLFALEGAFPHLCRCAVLVLGRRAFIQGLLRKRVALRSCHDGIPCFGHAIFSG